MTCYIVTVLNRETSAFRSIRVIANTAEKAKELVIAGLYGSDTVYETRPSRQID